MMRRMGFRPGSHGMPDVEREPDAERDVYHRWRAALLIAPGRRYRLEYEGDYGGRPTDLTASRPGRSGRRTRRRSGRAASRSARGCRSALFRPAGLFAGFTLDVGGPITAAAATRSP